MSSPAFSGQCPLRNLLSQWAVNFTQNEALQRRLVEKTIDETLLRFPAIENSDAIEHDIASVMQRVAQHDFGLDPVELIPGLTA